MQGQELVSLLRASGFKGEGLRTMYAIMLRESGGNPSAYNGNTKTGDRSYGLAQINMLGNLGPSRVKQFGLASEKDLLDPVANARAAYQLSKGGRDFGAWGIGPNAYRQGAGFDTIKKYYDQFPGSPQGGTGTFRFPQMAQTAPAAPAVSQQQFFADAIRQGKWRVGASLAQTLSLTSEFNRAYAKQPVPGHPEGKVYPKLQGKVPAEGAPIVQEAYKWLGTPYSWAGGGLGGPSKGVGRGANTVGFDCSGFLQYLWGKQGIRIPRVTYDQWRAGTPVDFAELQPGDAVFFHPGPDGPEHVGMYIGDGKFIQAPRTGDVVKISSLSGRRDYMGARRYGGIA